MTCLKHRVYIAVLVILIAGGAFTSLSAKLLGIQRVTQEQDQWCWAAVSKAIIYYYGTPIAQCTIANWVRQVATWHNFGNIPCCTDASQGCNYWNYMYNASGSIREILKHWGISNTATARPLFQNEVNAIIDDNRPFVIRWGWDSGGGHFLVGYGESGSSLYYMNPWPGEGNKVATYNWVVSGGTHTWTHSLTATKRWTVSTYKLTISSTAGGSTTPLAGAYNYPQQQTVTITANPNNYFQFDRWSGGLSSTANPTTVTMNANKKVRANFLKIYAPASFSGQRVLNRSLSQAEYINILNWSPHPLNKNINRYDIYIYISNNWTKLTECSADTTTFQHRGVNSTARYDYAIVAVTTSGRSGYASYVVIQ